MSRPLLFGCKRDDKIYQEQVLPGLLNKTKTTTIRPMWKTVLHPDKGWREIPKHTKYKVGDICKAIWNCRSKYRWFCKGCGYRGTPAVTFPETPAEQRYSYCCNKGGFHKQLGKVRIIEVIPIEMLHVGPNDIPSMLYDSKYKHYDFPKEDGFKNIWSMMQWFNKHYDLSKTRRFEIRRFEWL